MIGEQEVLYQIAEVYKWPGMIRHGTFTYFNGTDQFLGLKVRVPHVGECLELDLHVLTLSADTTEHVGRINQLVDDTNRHIVKAGLSPKMSAAEILAALKRPAVEAALATARGNYQKFGMLRYAPSYDFAVIAQMWREEGRL